MTWVLGLNGPGYVAMVSDIQVSWNQNGNRKFSDVLKKSYVICPNMAIGFAGSVKLGFEAMDIARKIHQSKYKICNVDLFIKNYKQMLSSAITVDMSRRLGGIRLLILGIKMEDDIKLGLHTRVITLDGEDGFRKYDTRLMGVSGIGSGQNLYRDLFDKLNDKQTIWKNQNDTAPTPAIQFAHQVYCSLLREKKNSISRHIHFTFIARHGNSIELVHKALSPPSWVGVEPDAIGILSHSWGRDLPWVGGNDYMPKIATSWSELESILEKSDSSLDLRENIHTEMSGRLP